MNIEIDVSGLIEGNMVTKLKSTLSIKWAIFLNITQYTVLIIAMLIV